MGHDNSSKQHYGNTPKARTRYDALLVSKEVDNSSNAVTPSLMVGKNLETSHLGVLIGSAHRFDAS